MRPERFELPIRIVAQSPVPGVAMALQSGHGSKVALVSPASQTAGAVTFDLEVTVAGALTDGRPRLLGPCVQGPPEARFVYLPLGRYAGQADCEWGGRLKVPLGGLTWDDIEALPPGDRLVAGFEARSPKGGPWLASVRLLPPGWAPAT
jgi:hypothetical protein